MVIERAYEYIWRLISRDEAAEKIYREACYFNRDEKHGKEIFEYNLQNRAIELEMGSGIINPIILWDGLKKLDQEKPYDNGWRLCDVNKTEIFNKDIYNKETKWVEVALICEYDDWEHIAKLITIEE